MVQKRKKKVAEEIEVAVPQPKWIPLQGSAPYADHVRVSTAERHVILSFGQGRPLPTPGQTAKDTGLQIEILTVGQVFLNPRTAGELFAIMGAHIADYEQRIGKITPDGLNFDATFAE